MIRNSAWPGLPVDAVEYEIVTAGQRAQGKEPGARTREVTLDPGADPAGLTARARPEAQARWARVEPPSLAPIRRTRWSSRSSAANPLAIDSRTTACNHVAEESLGRQYR